MCVDIEVSNLLSLISDDPATWAGLMAACHTENTSCYLSGSAPRRQGLEQTLMAVVSDKGVINAVGLLAIVILFFLVCRVCLSVKLKNFCLPQCVSCRRSSGRWPRLWRVGYCSRQWLASCWEGSWSRQKLFAHRWDAAMLTQKVMKNTM